MHRDTTDIDAQYWKAFDILVADFKRCIANIEHDPRPLCATPFGMSEQQPLVVVTDRVLANDSDNSMLHLMLRGLDWAARRRCADAIAAIDRLAHAYAAHHANLMDEAGEFKQHAESQ